MDNYDLTGTTRIINESMGITGLGDLHNQQIDDLQNYRRALNRRMRDLGLQAGDPRFEIIDQDLTTINDLIRKLRRKESELMTAQLGYEINSLQDQLRQRGYHIVDVFETRGAFHSLPLPADIPEEEFSGGALNFRTLYSKPSITETWAAARAQRAEAQRARRAAAAAATQGLPLNLQALEGTPIDIPEVIPKFELDTTNATTPEGTPTAVPILAPRGVPYNALRARNVVENESDFTPRGTNLVPHSQGNIPYSRTVGTINNEINHYTEVVASGERLVDQLREQLSRNPRNGQVFLELQKTLQKLDRHKRKLQEMIDMQEAGFGEDIIYTDKNYYYPLNYTPPGGFADDEDEELGAGLNWPFKGRTKISPEFSTPLIESAPGPSSSGEITVNPLIIPAPTIPALTIPAPTIPTVDPAIPAPAPASSPKELADRLHKAAIARNNWTEAEKERIETTKRRLALMTEAEELETAIRSARGNVPDSELQQMRERLREVKNLILQEASRIFSKPRKDALGAGIKVGGMDPNIIARHQAIEQSPIQQAKYRLLIAIRKFQNNKNDRNRIEFQNTAQTVFNYLGFKITPEILRQLENVNGIQMIDRIIWKAERVQGGPSLYAPTLQVPLPIAPVLATQLAPAPIPLAPVAPAPAPIPLPPVAPILAPAPAPAINLDDQEADALLGLLRLGSEADNEEDALLGLLQLQQSSGSGYSGGAYNNPGFNYLKQLQ